MSPNREDAAIGVVATREANESVKHVLEKQTSQQKAKKRKVHTSACQRLTTIVSFVRRPQPIAFILCLGGPGNEVAFLIIDTGGHELLYNTRLSHLLLCA